MGYRLIFKSWLTGLALMPAVLLLTFCSALVNPDPDSLKHRDGGDVDAVDGADLMEDEGLADLPEEDAVDISNDDVAEFIEDVPDDGAADPIEDTPEEEIIVTDCAGHPDFTPCVVVTDPDRDYDICIGGECLSPGCGDESCNPPGPHFPIPDTNQLACYDDSAEIECPGTPGDESCATTDWCGQDAQYGWDLEYEATERFTVSEPGPVGQPVVLDSVTDLMWQGCPAGQSGSDCAGSNDPYTWSEALTYCDSLTWGGHGDWRLPDRYEIQSIVDFGTQRPSIDASAFPGTPHTYFWSLSSYEDASSSAWNVTFNDSEMRASGKVNENAVRCVRRGHIGDERFTRVDGVEPVVEDNVTGLEWQGCLSGQSESDCSTGPYVRRTWQDSLTLCEDLSWGDYEDWRLPNIKELDSIVDDHEFFPSINISVFPETPINYFWASTSYGPSKAWGVGFDDGVVYTYVKNTSYAVRCVRGGP